MVLKLPVLPHSSRTRPGVGTAPRPQISRAALATVSYVRPLTLIATSRKQRRADYLSLATGESIDMATDKDPA